MAARVPFLVLAIATSAALAAAGARAASAAWRIDPAHTSVGFTVDAVGFPRTKGTFSKFFGKISLDFARPERSSVAFRVSAASVDVGSPSFDDYLRTDAFFDVAKFPDIDFVSTSVRMVDPTHAEVTGDLSLRGVTRPITIEVAVDRPPSRDARRLGFTATGSIPRLAYGMNAGFPAISNDVVLTVTTAAIAP
ncbi:MAG: YceI family protein [Hyphomicrobiales bacterium]|nr:YceI family protein [Hyphomicrobiales bacterium]MDE2016737.1 YceI family protein [Hyphomicrobiales bacterium]